jgi:SET domain-containing protein
MADVVVKKSEIEGKGVFAARDFRKGEVVLKWDTGTELTKKEVKKLPERERKRYVTYLHGKIILMKPPERYVNHSCNANTDPRNYCDVAVRDIKDGEEITSDYSKSCDPDFRMKCNCGSEKCRKIIRAYSKKHSVSQK